MTVRRLGVAAVVAALCVCAFGPMAGCDALRRGVQKLTGAPTDEQVQASIDQLDAAKKQVADLERQKAQALAEKAKADALLADVEKQKASVRASIQQIASQLAGATGDVFNALLDAQRSMEARLRALEDQGTAAAGLAAQWVAEATKIDAAGVRANAEIAAATERLEGFSAATDSAIAKTLGFVSTAGEVAAQLGVPGAKAVSDQVVQYGTGALASILLTGPLAEYQRRKKKKAEQERNALGEVVVATEKNDLIKDDPAAKSAARAELSPAAIAALQAWTANVEKKPAMPAPASPTAAPAVAAAA